MKLDFFLAKHFHRMFLVYLKGYLLGICDIKFEDLISDKECEFCRWVVSSGLSDYGDMLEVKQLMDKHKEMHGAVEVLLAFEDTKSKLENLNKVVSSMSNEILLLLDVIEEKLDDAK